jgi:3-phosphoglycerate kinase
LKHVHGPLQDYLGSQVVFAEDCVGPARETLQDGMKESDVLLLENVRYYREENDNDAQFSRNLAAGIDIYVNDAFGNSHRPHASMIGVPRQVPERAAGFLVADEVNAIQSFLAGADHPSLAVIGGAKVAGKDGKIHVIRNLLRTLDRVAVVGKTAYYFLLALGKDVGDTITADSRQIDAPESDLRKTLDDCRQVLIEAERLKKDIVLPVDSVVETPDAGRTEVVGHDGPDFPGHGLARDLGPVSVERLTDMVGQAASVVWNGPLGYFEEERYQAATIAIAQALVGSRARALVGGGDTVAALTGSGMSSDKIHICTGGGAMLTMLTGKILAAVAALED